MPYLYDASNWVGEFIAQYDKKYGNHASDSLSIANLCIPGTHDSGTAHIKAIPMENLRNAVKCQALTIEEQLHKGIRYLDIRVKYKGNTFYIVHDGLNGLMDYYCLKDGNTRDYLTLASVLNTCESFLREYPEEFIIMSIKLANSSKNDGDALAGFLIPEYQNLFIAPTKQDDGAQTYPSVRAMNGKILLLRRFKTAVQIPAYDYTGWGSVTADNDGCFYLPSDGTMDAYAMIQDMYLLSPLSDIEEGAEKKVKYYLNCLKRYHMESINSQLGAPLLLLNFLSCTKLGPIDKLAKKINGSIVNYFCDNNPHSIPRGVTIMDFPSEDILNLIIGANFTLTK